MWGMFYVGSFLFCGMILPSQDLSVGRLGLILCVQAVCAFITFDTTSAAKLALQRKGHTSVNHIALAKLHDKKGRYLEP